MTAPADTLIGLAERCEAATEGFRELDCTIGKAIGFRPDYPESMQTSSPWAFSPLYTASLDAAMTLVPEGLEWKVFRWRNASKECPWLASADVYLGSINDPMINVFAAHTPALALCAAALRARAVQS